MKLVEKYKERLYDNEIKTGGYNYISDKIPEKLLKDVNITEFKKMYIQIIIALFDEGFIPQTEKKNIGILREFYKDSSTMIKLYYLVYRDTQINTMDIYGQTKR